MLKALVVVVVVVVVCGMYSLVTSGAEASPPPFRPLPVVVGFFLLLFFLTCALIFSGLSDPSTSSPSSSLVYPAPSTSSPSSLRFSPSSSFSLPLYSAIIDAGSAGSRVYLYEHRWVGGRVSVHIARDADGRPVEAKLEPGLSSYAANVSQAAASLDPLLSYLSAQLSSRRAQLPVPLYLYATAGLRFLPIPQQLATLDAAVARVQSLHPATLALTAPRARVISGQEEALFAWLALNHALGALHRPTASSAATSAPASTTAGLVELGGASVQVAFEMTPAIRATLAQDREGAGTAAAAALPSDYAVTAHLHLRCSSLSSSSSAPSSPSSAAASLAPFDDRDHFDDEPLPSSLSPSSSLAQARSVDDGSSTFHLYTATYLGYGANSARSRHLSALLAEVSREDPCQLRGAEQRLSTPAGADWTLTGTGDYDACRARLLGLLNLTAPCPLRPCTFNGVHQPLIDSAPALPTLAAPASSPASLGSSPSPSPSPPPSAFMPFYGFSELFYTSLHLFNLTGPYSYDTFSRTARAFCSLPYSVVHAAWKVRHSRIIEASAPRTPPPFHLRLSSSPLH